MGLELIMCLSGGVKEVGPSTEALSIVRPLEFGVGSCRTIPSH